MRCLVLLFAIFGMAYCGSSGEQFLDYNPLFGPPQGARGPAVNQNHGAMGDPWGARNAVQGGNSGNQAYDYPLYQGPPNAGLGPQVNQQHGYNGAPQVSGAGTGGSSNSNNAVQGAQTNNFGGNSGSNDAGAGAQVQPNIIPNGDSGEYNYAGMNGYVPPQGNNGVQPGMVGGVPAQSQPGGSSNSNDGGYNAYNGYGGANYSPNAAPVAGADAGLILQRQDLKQASGMSGTAVAGVVAGVVAVGAVGTAVAVVALKSAASPSSPA